MSRIYEALLRAEMDRAMEARRPADTQETAETAPVGNAIQATTDETLVLTPGNERFVAKTMAGDEVAFKTVDPSVFAAAQVKPFAAMDDLIFGRASARAAAAELVTPQAMTGVAAQTVAWGPAEDEDENEAEAEENRDNNPEPGSVEVFEDDPGLETAHDTTAVPGNGLGYESELEFGQYATPRVVAWHPDQKSLPALESRGALIEQIRVLRSRMHELRLDRPLKTIMVTSGLPQEGKSFVASNLAVGFAKFRNQRVLLIDADMRRGKLHRLLGAPQEPGLTDYLSNKATVAEVMQQMELPDDGELRSLASLTFIASGHDADNAADLSGNGRFKTLLEAVYDHFDWIIVDSSPVTLVADGVNLARVCDGVVMVVRAGVTKYEVAQRAQQELKAAKLVGVVLNAIKGASEAGYYGYDG